MKEKQDISLGKRMKAFLMDGKRSEASPDSIVVEEEKSKELKLGK